MAKYCSNCGAELKEGADVCLKCGKLLINLDNGDEIVKVKVKAPGISIASMILGIVACLIAVLMFFNAGSLIGELYYQSIVYKLSLAVGYTLFVWVPGVVGIFLSISGQKKAKTGIGLAGLLTSIISVALALLIIIYLVMA